MKFVEELRNDGFLDNPSGLIVDLKEINYGFSNSVISSRKTVNSIGGEILLVRGESSRLDNCIVYDLIIGETIMTYNVAIKDGNRNNWKFNYFQLKQIDSEQHKYMLSTIFLYLLLGFVKVLNKAGIHNVVSLKVPQEDVNFENKVSQKLLDNYFYIDNCGEKFMSTQDPIIFFTIKKNSSNKLRELINICG
jgi:hypothetical protein